jgi:hypothetical protein
MFMFIICIGYKFVALSLQFLDFNAADTLWNQKGHSYWRPYGFSCLWAALHLIKLLCRYVYIDEGHFGNLIWSLLCSYLPPPTTLSLGPNILLNTLFSNTLSLCSSLIVRDQVSHPLIMDKIIVLYIFIFKFLVSSQGDKVLWTAW